MAYLTTSVATTMYAKRLPISVWVFDQNGEDSLADVWADADATTQEQALSEATRVIDSLTYDGKPSSEGQESEFPRNGSTSIPKEVKDATLELALFLMKEHLAHDNTNPWVQRGRYVGATRIESVIAEGRESVSFGSTRSYYAVIHPYLKRWLKGNYRSVDYV